MGTEEIISATKDYYCYGEGDDMLRREIDFAKTLKSGEIIIDFGTGWGGRTSLCMAMANPEIFVFTFDYGRDKMKDEKILINNSRRMKKHNVFNLIHWIGEAETTMPRWSMPISILNIDNDGKGTYKQLERWVPFVKSGGKIFMVNYGYDRYSSIKKEVDEYMLKDKRLKFGRYDKFFQEIDVI